MRDLPLFTIMFGSYELLHDSYAANFLAEKDKRGKVTHCNTLQHTATHCNTLQYTAIHCDTLQYTAIHCNTL